MTAHYGQPPKVIWLRCGNQPVTVVEGLLRRHANRVAEFDQDNTAACLAILWTIVPRSVQSARVGLPGNVAFSVVSG
jgi:hypothetical protein